MTGEIPAFLAELSIHRLDLHDNEFIGCFPEELRSLCDDDVDFSGNIALPWQGDFDQFCNSSTQVGAPCEDGLPNTINSIDINCDCVTPITLLTEINIPSIRVFPNPVNEEIFIDDIEGKDEMICIISSIEGNTIDIFTTNHYDVSAYASGIYLLEIQNITTGQRSIRKFIKL